MKEGEEEKTKTYSALIWTNKAIQRKDIEFLDDIKVVQCSNSFIFLLTIKVFCLLIYYQVIAHWLWGLLSCCCCLVAKSCPTLLQPLGYSLPGSSVHCVSQARILERVAVSFSRGSSPPRDGTHVSCIGRRILHHWATRGLWNLVLNSDFAIYSLNDWVIHLTCLRGSVAID